MKNQIGIFDRRENCRVCGSKEVTTFLDFGNLPLAGDFRDKDMLDDIKVYPMDLSICPSCTLVQILNVVSPDVIFSDYRYLSSITQTLIKHFEEYASLLKEKILPDNAPFLVEFGCNDGVLLSPLTKLGVKCIGVDAAENVVDLSRKKGLDVIFGYFGEYIASEIKKEHGCADVITASNVFAHIDDLDAVMCGVDVLLSNEGTFVVEVHYIDDLLKGCQFDTVYHEHLCYYSLTSLKCLFKRHDLTIVDVQKLEMHGGTIRVFSKRKTALNNKPTDAVLEMYEYESQSGFHQLKTYTDFGNKVTAFRKELISILEKRLDAGRTISAYGAAGRATILLNYCNIGTDFIKYVVDESPFRVGRYVPGVGIPILGRDELSNNMTDDCLITAWNYKSEIVAKESAYLANGGTFIIPLPNIEFIEK